MEKAKLTVTQKFELIEMYLKERKINRKFPKEDMIEFIAERKALAKKSNKRNTDGKPTKAQLENLEIAKQVKEHLDKYKGVKYVFNMTYLFEEIGIEQKGKAPSVAKILVEQNVIKDLGVMTVDKVRRKHYETV